MNRTDRLYAIVQELRRAGPGGRTSIWLAERFEVSTRTIKRDMLALVESGTEIDSEDGCGGGYRLARSASLPPITFTAGEATAIAIAVSAEPQLPFRPEGRVALGKVLSSMTREQRARARDIGRRVWMRAPPTSLRPRCARVIDEAIRQHCVVHLDYRDASGQLTEKRPVEPMVLARTNGHWYLLAWCRTRAAGRWFRLDRITGARTTNEAVPDRDLEEVFGTPPADAQPVDLSARRAASR